MTISVTRERPDGPGPLAPGPYRLSRRKELASGLILCSQLAVGWGRSLRNRSLFPEVLLHRPSYIQYVE